MVGPPPRSDAVRRIDPLMAEHPDFATPSLSVRALFALKAAAKNPALALDLARKFVNRILTADAHARRLSEYAAFTVPEVRAIVAMTSATEARVHEVLEEAALREVREECLALARQKNVGDFTWGGFADVCYAICRLTAPEVAFETGVAFGWTSAFILAALEQNGRGHLYSVDLPAFRPGAERIGGAVVPDRLRHRWTLSFGAQATLLPEMLKAVERVDFFHYDSDKTYQGMKWGFETVWPKIAGGGVLMSDDVDNDAFLEFAASQRQAPVVIVKPTDGQRVALLKRS